MRPSSHESPDFCSSQDSLAFLNFVSTIMASAISQAWRRLCVWFKETILLAIERNWNPNFSTNRGLSLWGLRNAGPSSFRIGILWDRPRSSIHPSVRRRRPLRPSVASPFRIGCLYFLHLSCRIGIISVPRNDNLLSRSGAPHIVSQSDGGDGGRRYFHPLGICTESEKVYLTW